jgi:hypothetical protein
MMFRKLGLLFSLSPARKRLLIFGMVLAFYSYFLFLFFNKKVKFGEKEKSKQGAQNMERQTILDIRFLMKTLEKYIPWEFKCRHQAWIASYLLKKNQIPYTVFIGFKKNELGKIEGHAWTIAEEIFVSGFCQPKEYVIQSEWMG